MGGTWSQLRAVRRTTRRADSGPRAGCRAMAEQRAMLPWAALWLPMCPTWTQSAPRAVLQIRTRLWILGAPGRAGGRAPGHGSGQSEGRPDGPTVGHQRATGRMHGKGRMPPGRRGTPPWASLAERMGWHLVPAPCSPGGRPDGPPTGRAEGSGAGCSAMARQLQRGALRCPGWLWQ